MNEGRALGVTTRAVMQRWMAGHDTWMIAKHFEISEGEVHGIVAKERDRLQRVKETARLHREQLRLLRQRFSATPF